MSTGLKTRNIADGYLNHSVAKKQRSTGASAGGSSFSIVWSQLELGSGSALRKLWGHPFYHGVSASFWASTLLSSFFYAPGLSISNLFLSLSLFSFMTLIMSVCTFSSSWHSMSFRTHCYVGWRVGFPVSGRTECSKQTLLASSWSWVTV